MVAESVDRTWEESRTEAPLGVSSGAGQPVAADPRPAPVEADEEFTEGFPEEWKDDFEGLLVLGYLEAVVEIPYHQWVIRTAKPAAKLEAAEVFRPFEGSAGFPRAYKCALVAASLELVDGQPILPVSKTQNAVRQKYNYVINSWYDPIIDILYDGVEKLEARQLMVMRHLGILPDSPAGKDGS